jgi:hypothetical protein
LSDALLVTTRVSYFRNVRTSAVSALVKEAMTMRSSGHLLKRAGREFLRNLIWMAVVFGSLAAILVAATDLPLVGTMVFVGVSVAVLAAIVTVGVLWSGAPDEWPPVATTTLARIPPAAVIGPLAVGGMVGGGMVAEEETVAGEAYKAAFAAVRNDP